MSRPDTQLDSWVAFQPKIGKLQQDVLDVITSRGGAASFEIAGILHKPLHVAAPRCTELQALGIIRDSGMRVWNAQTKRHCIKWVRVKV
jgi:hypothetical protein